MVYIHVLKHAYGCKVFIIKYLSIYMYLSIKLEFVSGLWLHGLQLEQFPNEISTLDSYCPGPKQRQNK